MIPQNPPPLGPDPETPAQRAERLRRLKQRYGKKPVPDVVLTAAGLPSMRGSGRGDAILIERFFTGTGP